MQSYPHSVDKLLFFTYNNYSVMKYLCIINQSSEGKRAG